MSPMLADNSNPSVSVLTLSRPENRNALNIELIEALDAAVHAAEAQPTTRAIILCGAGAVFCAGLDLHEAADASIAHRSAESLAKLYRSLYHSPLVTIAAAHGSAYGGGAGLIAACDLAILTDDIKLGYPEVRRGLVPALVMCLLRRKISGRDLRQLLLLGETVDAAEAMRIGLANRVVPAESLMNLAMEMATQICLSAPGAIARTKSLIGELENLDADIETALRSHVAARSSEEAAEGMAAFREKRLPRWSL
jgi:methylglutaconyl-CoA hydratase